MFNDDSDKVIIDNIIEILGSRQTTKVHDRHLSLEYCKSIGLNVTALEEDNDLQDYTLSIHHSYMEIFELGTIYKIFANQNNNLFYS